MSEQEQDKEQPSPVDKRSSTGGKHHDSVEDLRRSTEEARKKAEDALGPEAQLEEEKKKAETYLANWQRAAADFQNYKRRTDQERDELRAGVHARPALGRPLPHRHRDQGPLPGGRRHRLRARHRRDDGGRTDGSGDGARQRLGGCWKSPSTPRPRRTPPSATARGLVF